MTDLRQPGGTAFALRDAFAWPIFSALAQEGERLGYAAVFLPEIGGRDALVALGELAGQAERLHLATGIVPMTSRTPLLTAMAASTVQERSSGRLVLGLGTGPPGPGALDRLRDMVGTVRRLLAGDRVEIEGRAMQLSLVPAEPVPIWISALGPRAATLAGAVADGVILNWCAPERVAEAVGQVREGADRAGRDPIGIIVAVYVRASLGEDPAFALRALRAAAGEYASYPAYARQFASMGLESEARAAAAARVAGRPDDVPEALVRAVCLIGEGATARDRLDAFREAGADVPVVYPVASGQDPPGSVAATLRAAAGR
jgi:alkanesulfonate monooxygenase SsuD/methylene tetrahydromethanopterin reductase-like flavin-dependent oxidoreductase (luciferase family)